MKSIPILFPLSFAALGCAAPSERIPENRTERQMLGMMEKFDRWDLDGDGRLDLNELKEASRITGIPREGILKFYDTNKDGSITLQEAQQAYQRRVDGRA